MSNNTNLVRIGGWSGIAMIVLFTLAVFLLGWHGRRGLAFDSCYDY